MEWSNAVIMEFLDLYEEEPVIWDPKNPHHNDRSLIHDAWKRIQSKISIECSLKGLKKKKETLMATFRKLSMKIKNSKRAGTNKIYKPEWFAYNKMASFLHAAYRPRETRAIERPKKEPDNNEDDLPDNEVGTPPNVADPVESSDMNTESHDEESRDAAATVTNTVNQGGPPTSKKRKAETIAHVEWRTDDAHRFSRDSAAKPKVAKDETYIFCELLRLKLRALDDDTREIAMHEINNLMFHLKYSRKKQQQQSDMPFHCFNQQPPGYFNNYAQPCHDTNRRESPVFSISSESSESYILPAQTPSNSGATRRGLNDNRN